MSKTTVLPANLRRKSPRRRATHRLQNLRPHGPRKPRLRPPHLNRPRVRATVLPMRPLASGWSASGWESGFCSSSSSTRPCTSHPVRRRPRSRKHLLWLSPPINRHLPRQSRRGGSLPKRQSSSEARLRNLWTCSASRSCSRSWASAFYSRTHWRPDCVDHQLRTYLHGQSSGDDVRIAKHRARGCQRRSQTEAKARPVQVPSNRLLVHPYRPRSARPHCAMAAVTQIRCRV